MLTTTAGIIIKTGALLSAFLMIICLYLILKIDTHSDPISLHSFINSVALWAERILCGSVFAGVAADMLHNKKRKAE